MSTPNDPADRQRRSWYANAAAWTDAVRAQRIESRRLVTDAAVVEAVLTCSPARVLDLGCGEGWLCRALSEHGIAATGIDASTDLVGAARSQGGGEFIVRSFAEVAAAPERVGAGFDVAVCNFSLLDEDLAPLLRSVPALLAPGGALLIQTVHPWSACGDGPYVQGWRTERFEGFGVVFEEPMPWFYRTLGDWMELLHGARLQVRRLWEPAHPVTRRPLSLLLSATVAAE